MNAYTQQPDVIAAVQQARAAVKNRPVSDITDEAGSLYVDLVMEGGGVLGIALVGYTYVLEQAGLRFLGLGGTSAGSINALMLAAIDTPAAAKSERLVDMLATMELKAFTDGDGDARDFTKAMLAKSSMFKLLWKAMQVVDNLKEDLGLHPGKAFANWIQDRLNDSNCATLGQMQAKLAAPPVGGYQLRVARPDIDPQRVAQTHGTLRIITAEVTAMRKVVLPEMAADYWASPELTSLSEFVRASMSVPFFFAPARPTKPAETPAARIACFMDGGIVSNFPISVFHAKDRVPSRPTFGVKLGIDPTPKAVDEPSELLGAIFDTARSGLDHDFLAENPDYSKLVASIDTGDHHWLDFELSEAAKLDLFARGARTAAAFLAQFDWNAYKELRAVSAQLHRMSS